MYFFLDGYNLLFTLTQSEHSLSVQRQKIIRFFQHRFFQYKIQGTLVFDGRVHRGEESGRTYSSPLEILYTPKGQSADSYIIEQIEISKNPMQITVISNDRKLLSDAKFLGAKSMKNTEFLEWILEKKKKRTTLKPVIVETRQNMQRLLMIFEKKLSEE